jgi:hypothetical protein
VCWSLALSLSGRFRRSSTCVCPSQGSRIEPSRELLPCTSDSGTTDEWLEAPVLQYLTTPSTSSRLTPVVPPRSAWLLLTVLSTHQRCTVELCIIGVSTHVYMSWTNIAPGPAAAVAAPPLQLHRAHPKGHLIQSGPSLPVRHPCDCTQRKPRCRTSSNHRALAGSADQRERDLWEPVCTSEK